LNQTAAIKPTRLPDAQTVTHVQHWTDRLFSFRVKRPQSLRFRSGEFVMIGLLKDDGKPLLRAYSIASPSWAGTLVHDALLPGKRLWFFATGTGIAPFASLVREPQTYEDYDQIILTHTCRDRAELTYGSELVNALSDDPLIGEMIGDKLTYYPTTTREQSPKMGRITDLLNNGEVLSDLGIDTINPKTDRAMVCGSLGLNTDLKAILESYGLKEGANSEPAEYVVEKAFVG
jgi:ferredoxin--NADP+ reductase